MNINKLRTIIELLAIFTIGVIIPLLWFKSDGFMALGHDMEYPLAPVDFYLDRLFTWTDRVDSFGVNQTDAISGVFIHGPEFFFKFIGFPLITSQKLTFIFWFTLPGISMYLLLKYLHPRKDKWLLRLSGSLLYMINYYLIQAWQIAERTKFSVVIALPLIILIFTKVIKDKKPVLPQAVLLGLLVFIFNGGSGIPLWGGMLLALVFWCVALLTFSQGKLIYKVVRLIKFGVTGLGIAVLLNSYWLIPYYRSLYHNLTYRFNFAGGFSGATTWSGIISEHASFTNLLRFQGIPEWYNNPFHPYASTLLSSPLLILLSILLPSLAFANFILYKRLSNKAKIYSFASLLVLFIALIFTAGSHRPTGLLYDIMLKIVPGFSMFRSPMYKFGMSVIFAYSYLIALGLSTVVDLLSSRLNSNLLKKYIRLVAFPVFLVCLLYYHFPVVTGAFFNWSSDFSTMVKVPDYIFESKKEIDNNQYSTRYLQSPTLDTYDKYSWKYFSLTPISGILTRKSVIVDNSPTTLMEKELIRSVFDQMLFDKQSDLIKILGTDKVIVRNDYFQPQKQRFSTKNINSAVLQSDMFSEYKQIGEWTFLNQQVPALPLIYSPASLSSVRTHKYDLTYAMQSPSIHIGDAIDMRIQGTNYLTSEILTKLPSNVIHQATCTNCDVRENIITIDPRKPLIMPGTKLYSLQGAYEKYQKNKISNTNQKIDFILGSATKKVAAIQYNFNIKENMLLTNQIFHEIIRNFEEIKNIYLTIDDQATKDNNTDKLFQYSRYFILRISDWKDQFSNENLQEDFKQLDAYLRKYITDLDLHLSPNPDIYNLPYYEYVVKIPRTGMYYISAYFPALTIAQFEELSISTQETEQKKTTQAPWERTEPVLLEKGTQSIHIGKTNTPYVIELSFNEEFVVPPTGSLCREYDIQNVNHLNYYKFIINQTVVKGRKAVITLYEKNSDFPEGVLVNAPRTIKEIPGEERQYITTFDYNPNKYVERITLKACADAGTFRETQIKINSIKAEIEYAKPKVFVISSEDVREFPKPKIEFVSLNQTKYLIRLSDIPDSFMIIFNSRLDLGWSIKKVNSAKASNYFSGEPKEYYNDVIEYPRQNKHIITDYIFRDSELVVSSNFHVNGFANAWWIDSPHNLKDGDVLLLEYDKQNILYKATMLSIFTLIVVIAYAIIKITKRH